MIDIGCCGRNANGLKRYSISIVYLPFRSRLSIIHIIHTVFTSVNNVFGVRVHKILNLLRLYRYKGSKFLVREAGGEVKFDKGGGRRTPCVPSLLTGVYLNKNDNAK